MEQKYIANNLFHHIFAASFPLGTKSYNINGTRVNKATKGLYIVNGKKIVMK